MAETTVIQSSSGSKQLKSLSCGPSSPVSMAVTFTHFDWDEEGLLIHFQGQDLDICESEYKTLRAEIQKTAKTATAVSVGGRCLVEDEATGVWYRGRVNGRKGDSLEVFLLDHGDILSVDISNVSSAPSELFSLPPRITCGFLANVLLLKNQPLSAVQKYLSKLVGRDARGSIKAVLPHNVLLFDAPDINSDLVNHGYGRHVDTNTFFLSFEMLTKVPVKNRNVENTHCPELYCKRFGWRANKDILLLQALRLTCGTRTKVRVSAAVNPGHFYCQMASQHTELLEMSKRLSAVCEDRVKERTGKDQESLGLLCSVKGRDGNWYRGLVQYLPGSSQVLVLFIDYGFSEPVEVENIHKLPPDFDSVPIMALQCSLFSPSHQDEEVRAQQLSFLKQGLLGRVLDVEIKGFDKELHLYSLTVTGVTDRLEEPAPPQVHPGAETKSDLDKHKMFPHLLREAVLSRALEKSLEAEDVRVGSAFVGHVMYVEDPNRFWIQTQKCNDDFEDMMARMSDHFSQKKVEEDVLLNPKPGDQCCAVYEKDMHFYRAVVTETLQHGAEVHFIDFGNTEKVPHVLIKKMPEAFGSKAPFAFCCSLVNVWPFQDGWTTSTSGFFRRTVLNRSLLVSVVQIKKNKCVVDLHEMEKNSKQSISELFISTAEGEGWTNELLCFAINERNTRTSDIYGKIEQVEEEKSPSNEKGTDRQGIFSVVDTIPGSEFLVCCSSFTSPSDFWCRCMDKSQDLEKLMEKLQLHYSTHRVPLTTGTLCCVAKSPIDDKWYRAFILSQCNRSTIQELILVDYGFIIKVNKHSLQGLMPEFNSLETQAFRCSLYDLMDPRNCGIWSMEMCDKLKASIRNSPNGLRCKVLSQVVVENKGMYNIVDLHTITPSKHSIRDLLLEQGLAPGTTVSTKQLLRVSPETYVFSSFGLRPEKEEQMFVTHISSLWDIYCQLVKNVDVIEKLEEKISEEREKIMPADKKVTTKLCLAKYLDGNWYRGVANCTQSSSYLSVFFVDYGNIKVCEKSQVLSIPEDLSDLLSTPMQAVRCSLASVPQVALYADVKDWLDKTVLNQQVRVRIVEARDDGSFSVQMFSGHVNVNDQVKKLIQSLCPQPDTSCSNKKTDTRRVKKRVPPSVKSKIFPAKKKQKASHAADPAQRKTKMGSKKISVSAKPQQTDPKKARLPKLSCLPKVKVTEGFSATCFVSHVNSVDSFFLQLSEDESAILKMGKDLNSEGIRDSESLTSPETDDLVLAKYEDGALYRCVVRGLETTSLIIVEFIDYGNSELLEKVYSIPKKYLSQPRFSIPCSLLDTSAYKDHVSFTEAVMEKPLLVEFVSQCGSHWKVRVLDGPAALAAAPEAATKEEAEQKELQGESSETVDGGNTQEPRSETRAEAALAHGIQAGDTETCTVTAVFTEHMFYVRLNRASHLVTELERCIAENLDQCEMVPENHVKEGLECLVQLQPEAQWCRAVVLMLCHLECQVLLVDQGSRQSVLKSSLRKQGTKVRSIQNLAVLCRLSQQETSRPAVGQRVQLVFSRFSVILKLWEVELITLGASSLQQDKEMVQSQGEDLAGGLGPDPGSGLGLSLGPDQGPDPHPDPSPDPGSDQGPDPDPGPDLGSAPDPGSDLGQPQRLHLAPVTLHRPYDGYAATVASPSKFCVVLDDSLLVMYGVFTKLAKLDQMPDAVSPLPAEHLVPASGCLLRSHTQRRWCRAEVQSCTDTALVLQLVDYGHSESLAWEQRSTLRELPQELLELPKVAYRCTLRGVRPAGGAAHWTDQANIFFQESFFQKMVQIIFRGFLSDSHWEVDILAGDVDMAQALVEAGHATPEPRGQSLEAEPAAPQDPEGEEDHEQRDEDPEEPSGLSEEAESDPSSPNHCVLQ